MGLVRFTFVVVENLADLSRSRTTLWPFRTSPRPTFKFMQLRWLNICRDVWWASNPGYLTTQSLAGPPKNWKQEFRGLPSCPNGHRQAANFGHLYTRLSCRISVGSYFRLIYRVLVSPFMFRDIWFSPKIWTNVGSEWDNWSKCDWQEGHEFQHQETAATRTKLSTHRDRSVRGSKDRSLWRPPWQRNFFPGELRFNRSLWIGKPMAMTHRQLRRFAGRRLRLLIFYTKTSNCVAVG